MRRFDRPITALAVCADGGLAVALDGREVQVFADAVGAEADAPFSEPVSTRSTRSRRRPTGTLLATDGSRRAH